METLNKLLAIDLNYIIIGLIVLFYSLEQLLNTQFQFNTIKIKNVIADTVLPSEFMSCFLML